MGRIGSRLIAGGMKLAEIHSLGQPRGKKQEFRAGKNQQPKDGPNNEERTHRPHLVLAGGGSSHQEQGKRA